MATKKKVELTEEQLKEVKKLSKTLYAEEA